jgi:DNA modification methylase
MTLQKPYYERDGITIYCGDCREIAPQLGLDFALVSDPPYGMKANLDSTRFTGGHHKRGEGRDDWTPILGDSEPFDPTPWLNYPRIVLFGANHFSQRLPVGTTLVWIKKADHLFGTFLSDAEIAWMKGGHGVYCFRKQFPPPSRMAEGMGSVAHPTQKPECLMEWVIHKSGLLDSMPVLDPYCGSGTTLVAARACGRKAIGIELEERYCEIAAKRLAQGVLFK